MAELTRFEAPVEVTGATKPDPKTPAGETLEVTPEVAPEVKPTTLEIADEGRPGWLDPKFKSPEDMAKAYRELEQKLSKPADPKAPKADEKPATPDGITPITEAEWNAYQSEVTAHGELTQASYDALAKRGLTKPIVDMFIADQKSKVAAVMDKAFAAFGGAENYPEVVNWAKANLSTDEIRTYTESVRSGDPAKIMFAVNGLAARYNAANGDPTSPAKTRLSGSKGPAGVAQPFRSQQEVTRAMNDPRYRQGDPAFQAEVRARLAVTNLQ